MRGILIAEYVAAIAVQRTLRRNRIRYALPPLSQDIEAEFSYNLAALWDQMTEVEAEEAQRRVNELSR